MKNKLSKTFPPKNNNNASLLILENKNNLNEDLKSVIMEKHLKRVIMEKLRTPKIHKVTKNSEKTYGITSNVSKNLESILNRNI